MLLSPHFKKTRFPKTPQAFCRFPWERMDEDETREAIERSHVSQAEVDALNALFNNKQTTQDDDGKDR